eukprot:5589978-Amphidinium_carterae.1
MEFTPRKLASETLKPRTAAASCMTASNTSPELVTCHATRYVAKFVRVACFRAGIASSCMQNKNDSSEETAVL